MKGLGRAVLLAGVAAWTVGLAAATASGQEPAPSPAPPAPRAVPSPEASPAPSPSPSRHHREPVIVRDHRTVRSFPANLGHNALEAWAHPSVMPFVVGAAATASGFLIDHDTVTFFDKHLHRTYGDIGKFLGTGLVAAGASTAVFGVGRYANGDRFRAATYDMSQAVIVNFFYTTVIKEAVRRARPDKSDNLSFPSGHASNAFACAQVWVEQYGWKAAVPGYLAASFIAGSRLALKKHYVSDVVGGAVVGFIVGKSVARYDAKPSHKPLPGLPPAAQVSVGPITAPDGSGLGLGLTVRY